MQNQFYPLYLSKLLHLGVIAILISFDHHGLLPYSKFLCISFFCPFLFFLIERTVFSITFSLVDRVQLNEAPFVLMLLKINEHYMVFMLSVMHCGLALKCRSFWDV